MKRYFPHILLVFFITILTLSNIYPLQIFFGDNKASILFPDSFIIKSMFVWNETNGFGSYFPNINQLPLFAVQKILGIIFPLEYVSLICYCLFNILIVYSAVFFIKSFRERYLKDFQIAEYVYYICGFFYFFNFNLLHALYDGQMLQIVPFFLIPFGLGIFLKYIEKPKAKYLLAVSLLLFLNDNVAHFFVFMISLAIFGIMDFLVSEKKLPIKRCLIFLSVLFLLNAYFIIPFLKFYTHSYYQVRDNPYIDASTIEGEFYAYKENQTLSGVFRNLVNPGVFSIKGHRPVDVNNVLLFFPFFLFILLLTGRKPKKIVLVTFGFYLLSLFIIKGAANPHGELFEFTVRNVPGMVMFRSIHFKWNYILLLFETILFLLAIIEFSRFGKSSLSKRFFVGFILLLSIMPNFGFLTELYNRKYMIGFPFSYIKHINAFSDLSEKGLINTGFLLPMTNNQWTTQTTFGLWSYSFFSQSTNTLGFIDQGTATSNSINDELYQALREVIYSEDTEAIMSFFNKNFIDFFIVQKDFDYSFKGLPEVKNQEKQINNLIISLSSAGNIEIIQDNEYFSVYKINIVKKPILSAEGFDYPIQKISPVKYRIYISDNSDIGYLDFYKTFDKEWNLYYRGDLSTSLKGRVSNDYFNVKDVSYLFVKPFCDKGHRALDEKFNRWVFDDCILKQGYYDIYFTPQSYLYLGVLVSSTTFLAIVAYILFNFLSKNRVG